MVKRLINWPYTRPVRPRISSGTSDSFFAASCCCRCKTLGEVDELEFLRRPHDQLFAQPRQMHHRNRQRCRNPIMKSRSETASRLLVVTWGNGGVCRIPTINRVLVPARALDPSGITFNRFCASWMRPCRARQREEMVRKQDRLGPLQVSARHGNRAMRLGLGHQHALALLKPLRKTSS